MSSLPEKFRENIMVTKTRLLYREFPFEGFLPAAGYNFIERITKIHERQERILVEDDATYQQIIPYIICYNPELQTFLVYQRAANHDGHSVAESNQFANKRSLGIGGHILEIGEHGIAPDEFIIELGKQILEEEVGNIGILGMSVIGYINDNSHPVERVHFGIVIGCMFTRKDVLFNKEKIQDLKLMKKDELLVFLREKGQDVELRTQTLDTMIEHGEIF